MDEDKGLRIYTVSILKEEKPEQYPKEEILNDQDRLAKGWISIESTDSDNELIPLSELRKTLNIWMDRGAPISDQHTNRMVGKGLRWYEKEHSTGNPGIMLEYKIFKNYSTDDEVWKDIKTGKRKGLSFGGRATKAPTFKDGGSTGPTRELHGVESMEVASVAKPAHPLALNTAVNYLAKADKTEINPDESATDLKGNDLIALELYGKSYDNLTDGEKEQCKLRKKLADAVVALVKGMVKKKKNNKEYEEETEKINESAKSCKYPHKFEKAKWTYPNGHPRCKMCGQEESIEGICEKSKKEETEEGEEPDEEKIIKKFLINRIDKKLDNISKFLRDYRLNKLDNNIGNMIGKIRESEMGRIEKNLNFMINTIEKAKI